MRLFYYSNVFVFYKYFRLELKKLKKLLIILINSFNKYLGAIILILLFKSLLIYDYFYVP